jgi:hypothetical protein
MPSPADGSSPFSGLSVEEGYTRFLTHWKQSAEAQIAALRATDWKTFEDALHRKDTLIQEWEAFLKERQVSLDRLDVSSVVRDRWLALARESEALDREIDSILQTLRGQVRTDVRRFEQERRAVRSYSSRLKHLSPRYLDKKL